jgi:hypothetical protein
MLQLAALTLVSSLLPSIDTPKVLDSLPVQRRHAFWRSGFEENNGQWDRSVRFLGKGNGVHTWITRSGVIHEFYRYAPHFSAQNQVRQKLLFPGREEPSRLRSPQEVATRRRESATVAVSLIGAGVGRAEGVGLESGVSHYLIGEDRSKWARDVRRFREVMVRDIYPGVDQRWYLEDSRPRYDFIIRPGADPRRIRLRYEGASSLQTTDFGGIVYWTALGMVEERGLRADQDGVEVPIRAVTYGNEVRFQLGPYDRSRTLVIDPIVWSLTIEGSGNDYGLDVALTRNGAPVVSGYTDSPDFPTTHGSRPGGFDAFVAKLNPDGSSITWCTYFGGNGIDTVQALVLRPDGSPLIAGDTTSGDLPEKRNGLTTRDAFVAELSPDGREVVWSRYIGGGNNMVGSYAAATDLALTTGGSPVLAGYSHFAHLEGSLNDLASPLDAFVSVLEPDGSKVRWTRYFGGAQRDSATSVAIRPDGSVAIAGATESRNLPNSRNAASTASSNQEDGFVAVISDDGTRLLWSRYVGGSSYDTVNGLCIGGDGSPILAGHTQSNDLPMSRNVSPSLASSAFVSRFSSNGHDCAWSSYIGSHQLDWGGEYGYDLVLGPGESLAIAGVAESSNLSGRRNEYQGSGDGFVAMLLADGAVLWTAYVGGWFWDASIGLAIRPNGAIVTTGVTYTGGKSSSFVAEVSPLEIDERIPSRSYGELFEPMRGLDPTGSVAHGVVCDNLPSTPNGALNGIRFPLKSGTTGRVYGRVVSTTSPWNHLPPETGGFVVVGQNEATYYPPDTFSRELTASSLRRVNVQLVVVRPDGRRFRTIRSVFLARPPAVLVHGINNDPTAWTELVRSYKALPWVALNNWGRTEGNDPVELGASRLQNVIRKTLKELREGSFEPTLYFETGDDYRFRTFRGIRFSARRVDLVGWSYGGMIARWYLGASGGSITGSFENSLDWYKREKWWSRSDSNLDWPEWRDTIRAELLPTTDRPPLRYEGDVRKLITLSSMWRGVPTCNWTNEILAVGGRQIPALGDAPSAHPLHRTLYDTLDNTPLGKVPPVRVASQEVMAVGSPWLHWLIYRARHGHDKPAPFVPDVAYHAIGGDNNQYNSPFDPYRVFEEMDSERWFPYFALEVRNLSTKGFSDGIVPLWSQLIPGAASTVLPIDHNDYPKHDRARRTLVDLLQDPYLQVGWQLNNVWGQGGYVESNPRSDGTRFRWDFGRYEMAPWPQYAIYRQIDRVGRIQPGYVKADDLFKLRLGTGTVAIDWRISLPLQRIDLLREDGMVIRRITLPGEVGTIVLRRSSGSLIRLRARGIYETFSSSGSLEQRVKIDSPLWAIVVP